MKNRIASESEPKGLIQIVNPVAFEQVGEPKLIMEPLHYPSEHTGEGTAIGKFRVYTDSFEKNIKEKAPKRARAYMIGYESAILRTLTGNGESYPKVEVIIPIVYYKF